MKYSGGKILSMREVIGRIAQSLKLITNIVLFGIQAISVCIGLYTIHHAVPVVVLAISLVFIALFYRSFESALKLDKEADKVRVIVNEETKEVVDGFMEVRVFNKEKEHYDSLTALNAKIADLHVKKATKYGFSNLYIEVLDSILTVGGVIFAMIAAQKGIITASYGITLVVYLWKITNPLCMIVDELDELSTNLSYLPEFDEMMKYENVVKDGKIKLESFNSDIKLNNLSFSYDSSDEVLHDINLTIHKGEKIGICGSSGGGKSTILKLLQKFYLPTKGSISIDDIDISELTNTSMRSFIGVVEQETHILNNTIWENIRYARSNASDYEVIEAAKKAEIYDFIQKLPEGFDTNVGPNGLKLSGGQKQRIALARIFLCDPEIVILDEATSALDSESERLIQHALDNLNGKTIIAVAHRLGTIKNSDKIVVIKDHKIYEKGTHSELMSMNGEYAHMYKLQMDEENK
jgi:ABC-type multidrug transport system fused ATPase/permease subunit